jgi:isopentenyl-diphosphate delta-isomerase
MVTEVILVNEQDEAIGKMEKMEAHEKGLLHRAFSVFIFNKKGELLLHQRATNKYHSPQLWSNTCCSHPAPGENILEAAHRRLNEEMGFDTALNTLFSFIYKTEFENGLTEHELDHVLTGYYDGPINPNETEVKDYCFKNNNEIMESMLQQPHKYTSWFKIALPKLVKHLADKQESYL